MTPRPEKSHASPAGPAPRRRQPLRWRILQRVALHGLIAFCLLVLGVRALLLGLAGSQAEVALWLSETVGLPVTVSGVHAEWSGWSPAVAVEGVRLGEGETGIGIEHVSIAIDTWNSLRRGEVVPARVTVEGLDLILEELPDGRLRVQGVTTAGDTAATALDAVLFSALSRIQRLELDARRVVFRTPRLPREIVLAPLVASIVASTQAAAELHLEANIVGSGDGRVRAHTTLDATGPSGWYAEAEGIGLAYLREWLPGLPAELSGRAALELWAPQASDDSIPPPRHFRLHLHEVVLDEPLFDEVRIAGDLLPEAGADSNGLALRARIERASSPRGRWPDTEFALAIDGPLAAPTGLRLAIGFLRLDDLSPALVRLAPGPQRDGSEAVRGDFTDLRLRWAQAPGGLIHGLDLRAAFSGLGLRLPAVALAAERSEGRVALNAGRGLLSFRAARVTAEASGGLGIGAIDALHGAIGLRLGTDGARFSFHELALAHPALALRLDGTLKLPVRVEGVGAEAPDHAATGTRGVGAEANLTTPTAIATGPGVPDSPADESGARPLQDALRAAQADLQLLIEGGELARLHELLPTLPALAGTRAWMREHLLGGHITQGRGLFRGPLGAWPHADASGRSELQIDIGRGRLRFNPEWPVAEDIDARLELRGAALAITGRSARLLDVRLREGTGSLPDVLAKQPMLKLDMRLAATGPATRRLLNNSPLRRGPGQRLARVNVTGSLDYTLVLDIPLRPGPLTTVAGQVHFAGNDLDVGGDIRLTNIRGALPFAREDWGGGPPLEARYAGLPVEVRAGSLPAAGGGGTEVSIQGRAGREFLAGRLAQYAEGVDGFFDRHRLWPRVSGEAPFSARIHIPPREAPVGAETTLRIESSLAGLAIDLPAPFGKQAAATAPLLLAMGLDEAPVVREIEVRIGETAARVRLRRARGEGPRLFAGAGVRLGEGEVLLPDTAVVAVRGMLPTLSLTAWKRVLDTDAAEDDAAPDLDLDFRTGELLALGQRFRDLRIIGQRDNGGWSVALASADADGRINWPRGGGPLSFEFHRLALNPDPDAPEDEATDPASLPAIIGAVNDFHFAGNALGRMRMSTRPLADGSGLSLEELQFESDRFRVDASGQWLARGLSQRSTFRIEVDAPDFGHLLASFGYDTGAVEGGRTRMVIDARWPGAPDDFRLEALSGEMQLELGKGRLLDVEPAAGRLFGLLSLQTLPRRLALDFGDLFLEGFSFDRIEGTFRLEAGNAHTEDLTMVGPAAEVRVTGRTGLADRDYDQRVRVKPNLSEALPVAGALFGPVGIGIGAAVYLGQRIFRQIPDAIDRLFARHYTVTGPWTDPVIEKVDNDTGKPAAGKG